MVLPENLVRKHLQKVKAYSSARDEYDGEIGIFLDANENSFGSVINTEYNRYPDPHHKSLKEKWSRVKRVAVEQIFFGNGSDEPIDLIIRLFCEPGQDNIITMPPTYGMYEVSAAINNVLNKRIPLTSGFQIDIEHLKSEWSKKDKVIFICSPNNPSGNLLNESAILEILNNFPGVVVIDEAYIDFSSKESWTRAINKYPNLIVLQTLSKAWGMAAVRVGVAMGSPYVISMLDKIKPPYNLSQPNQRLASEALDNQERKNVYVQGILAQREILTNELAKFAIVKKIVPSDANFLLVEFELADRLFDWLINEKVIVRNRTKQLHCGNCLRITVGKPEENRKLLNLIGKFEKLN